AHIRQLSTGWSKGMNAIASDPLTFYSMLLFVFESAD
ncbi:hypothetical protein AAKU61_004187, partial [Undibacterium sp. GrIS 1.2]